MTRYKKTLKKRCQTKLPLGRGTCIYLDGGFTLLELILYMAISSIFMLALISFAWDLMYGRVRAEIQENVNANALFASRRIAYEIKNASGIINVTSSSITLSNPVVARNPTVIDFSSGRLRIGYGSSGNCPTTSPCFLSDEQVTVSNVSFQSRGTGNSQNIEYGFTITSTGGPNAFDYSQSIESTSEIRSL